MTSRADNRAANLVSSVPWGDRTRLLPKATAYAFSIDLVVLGDGPYLSTPKALQQLQPMGGLRHMFAQPIVEMPGGLRCEVPTGTVVSADGEIGDAGDAHSNWMRLRIVTRLGEIPPDSPQAKYAPTLSFATTGVLELSGGAPAYRLRTQRLHGSLFLASVQESSTTAYRWLERRQLFGIGRVKGENRNPATAQPAPPQAAGSSGALAIANGWELHFSIDFYGAE